MIRFGTSGFWYKDWVGPVYPADLADWGRLPFYAEQFDTVELNVTYYRLPTKSMVDGWVKRTPDGFLFSVKAHKSLTHERQEADFQGFRESIAGLVGSGKLACILAQFPHSFHPTEANRGYLPRLREGLADLPTAIEFRDSAWLGDETFEQLEDLNFGFCCVDEPRLPGLMPPVVSASGPLAYVRFHGRNAEHWWQHEEAWQRYDYTYQDSELSEWIPRLRELDAEVPLTLVYANNHYRGQSTGTLRQLQRLLGEG